VLDLSVPGLVPAAVWAVGFVGGVVLVVASGRHLSRAQFFWPDRCGSHLNGVIPPDPRVCTGKCVNPA